MITAVCIDKTTNPNADTSAVLWAFETLSRWSICFFILTLIDGKQRKVDSIYWYFHACIIGGCVRAFTNDIRRLKLWLVRTRTSTIVVLKEVAKLVTQYNQSGTVQVLSLHATQDTSVVIPAEQFLVPVCRTSKL